MACRISPPGKKMLRIFIIVADVFCAYSTEPGSPGLG
jgi:hypothetical protein